jgi:hypothetical protein
VKRSDFERGKRVRVGEEEARLHALAEWNWIGLRLLVQVEFRDGQRLWVALADTHCEETR